VISDQAKQGQDIRHAGHPGVRLAVTPTPRRESPHVPHLRLALQALQFQQSLKVV